MDTLTKTKDITKDLIPDIRSLSRWDPEDIGPNGKYEQQKLTGDFQKAATDFQNAQRLALEKQKDYVKEVKAAIDEDTEDSPTHTMHSQQQLQQQQGIQLLDNAEVEFNEQLIEERELEIQGIEQGITELNEIFKDLATIVVEQGSLLGTSFPWLLTDNR
jgi:syntaxin 7